MNLLNSFSVYVKSGSRINKIHTINREVRDFGIEIADLIANRAEIFFHYPTPEYLYDKVKGYVINEVSQEELYYKCVEWSNDELRMKIANYPVIVMSLLALVHANYRRALNGETLKSLRTITHISQNQTLGPQLPQANQERRGILGGLFKPKT